MRRPALYPTVFWTLSACSSGQDQPRGMPGAGADAAAEPPAASVPAQSESSNQGTVPMKVVATVDGKTYRSSGMGECASSAESSIYEVPATQWHAMYDGPDGPSHLNLTVWRPKAGGGDMVGLSLMVGETTHSIATVKGGKLAGKGTPGVQPAGAGGTLTVTGTDQHGDEIEVAVECQRFDEVVAEGG